MKIRIIETRTYEYEPNLEDEFYEDRDVKTINHALAVDKFWIDKSQGDVSYLDMDPSKHRVWQVVDDEGKVVHEEK